MLLVPVRLVQPVLFHRGVSRSHRGHQAVTQGLSGRAGSGASVTKDRGGGRGTGSQQTDLGLGSEGSRRIRIASRSGYEAAGAEKNHRGTSRSKKGQDDGKDDDVSGFELDSTFGSTSRRTGDRGPEMRVGKDGQGKEDARLTRIVLVRTLVLVLLAGLILLGIVGLQRRSLRKAVFFAFPRSRSRSRSSVSG